MKLGKKKEKEAGRHEGRLDKAAKSASTGFRFGLRCGIWLVLVYGMAGITLYMLPYLEAFIGSTLGVSAQPGVADVMLWLFSGLFALAWVLWLEFRAAAALWRLLVRK